MTTATQRNSTTNALTRSDGAGGVSVIGPRLTLRHEGRCGSWMRCWRTACRAEFGDYPTIEILADRAIAYCHRDGRLPLDDPRLASVAA